MKLSTLWNADAGTLVLAVVSPPGVPGPGVELPGEVRLTSPPPPPPPHAASVTAMQPMAMRVLNCMVASSGIGGAGCCGRVQVAGQGRGEVRERIAVVGRCLAHAVGERCRAGG